ncbi:MAG: tetratricopeptide repeat protein [Planctomycetes bacterium]|nr:tetratricopeptide repeat protein [Planctomycetota bacterium]
MFGTIQRCAVAVVFLHLTGCSQLPFGLGRPAQHQPPPEAILYDTLLSQSHAALQAQDPAEAIRVANHARQVAAQSGLRDDAALLLLSEALSRQGRGDEAERFARAAVERAPSSPSAGEALAKAYLVQGLYGQADQALSAVAYTAPEDCQRVHDLKSYCRGLRRYAAGDPQAAFRTWGEIRGLELRAAVEDALRNPSATSLAGQDTRLPQ